MGLVSFHSQWVGLQRPAADVHHFFDDLNNLEKLMPAQIINWKSDSGSCSFDIKGMAHIGLRKTESVPGKLIRIAGVPENPIELEFTLLIQNKEEGQSMAQVTLDAHLSQMLKLMASDPLQNLVDIMAGKLKEAISQT